jgi:hypothetical protein
MSLARELKMTRFFLTTASLVILASMGAVGASAANIAQPPPGTVVYGPVRAAPPAGMVPPTGAPVGYHYEWVYSYDHHGYRAHWEAERNS